MSNRLAGLLASPQLNGWGFIIGIFGLLFSFYTYLDSQSYPNLVAQVHPSKTVLVSNEGVQDLTVYANGKIIKGPVTSAHIAIWNAGTKPIRAEDVLEKIQIRTNKPTQLLSVRILETTRDVTNIQTDISKASMGIIGVSFNILEKSDAALLQITYEGDEQIDFVGSGSVVGQKKFDVTKLSVDEKKEKPAYQSSTKNKILLIGLLIVSIFFLIRIAPVFCRDLIRTKNILLSPEEKMLSKISSFIELAFGIIIIVGAGYIVFGMALSIPTTVSPYLSN